MQLLCLCRRAYDVDSWSDMSVLVIPGHLHRAISELRFSKSFSLLLCEKGSDADAVWW